MYFDFDNSYLLLKPEMYEIINRTEFRNPEYLIFNDSLSKKLGINEKIKTPEGALYLSGKNPEIKYAQAYAGHQFGYFNVLGDGRALMLGEHLYKDKRTDIHLKGSGRTSYSRGGDGKGTLYSMLREYIISESLSNMNIPTTRTLAVLKTNEKIQRAKIENGGLLVRTAESHIRVGTFQFAATQSKEHVNELLEYTISRHFPELLTKENKPLLFLEEVMNRQIKLVVQWQSIGFIHGVMNTDNMLVSGESIDYGPCAFMNNYDPNTVFSSIDRDGRYKYANQPYMASFNIVKLAESLLPLIDNDIDVAANKLNAIISKFESKFKQEYLKVFSKKLGILKETDYSLELIEEFLIIMKDNQLDFTNTFKDLTTGHLGNQFDDWVIKWKHIIKGSDHNEVVTLMRQNNPVIIPRNHIVEDAITKGSTGDLSDLNVLMKYLYNPFDYLIEIENKYLQSKHDDSYVTYCGT